MEKIRREKGIGDDKTDIVDKKDAEEENRRREERKSVLKRRRNRLGEKSKEFKENWMRKEKRRKQRRETKEKNERKRNLMNIREVRLGKFYSENHGKRNGTFLDIVKFVPMQEFGKNSAWCPNI